MTSTPLPFPPAVVMGLSPTGLHVVRSLAKAGAEVVGVAEGRQAGAASRYLSGVIQQTDDDSLLQALLEQAARWDRGAGSLPVLIPSSDQHVEFIVRHHKTLAQAYAFQHSFADGTAARIMAKDSFAKLCTTAAVAQPQMAEATRQSLTDSPPDLPFPWMVKPAQIHRIKSAMRGRKGWTIRDRSELSAAIDDMPPGIGTVLVQEIVPGPESNIVLACMHMAQDGSPRQVFTARKLRQFPPGFGSASLVQSTPEPEAADIAARLLSQIGYRGIAAAEFKRDPVSGTLKIIEINVRPSLWFSISEDAGRPVVLDSYRALAGLGELPQHPQTDGIRWRYAAKDLASAAFYRARPGFVLPAPDTSAVGPAIKTVYPVFDVADPRPSLADTANFLQKAVGRFVSRGSKE